MSITQLPESLMTPSLTQDSMAQWEIASVSLKWPYEYHTASGISNDALAHPGLNGSVGDPERESSATLIMQLGTSKLESELFM